ncbi:MULTISPECIES: AbrB/MazE/SpoVT family DNA-binding domain-containing protein [Xenorhabdus]|uniref:Transcriptional regulator n=1 Tax=Xenorhabdus khoisanae TaxID=880157 RepID=A0A0J5FUX6_9GAMM|nr:MULTISPECIES: AbrB/MazE/SpoVT family DNA-binding domain-containing protein [Xenorhabdus]KMJ46066.1 transcriptional regulator [Xenorhabdus khoisanae]MBC8952195.1 transcriptional regulator [Xenorhabdus sp. PB62.4]MDC9613683.1 AbrB/MazE/SpoVT family DNA-binding domain-containing protein [Xenorhabdus khoisanae]
MTAVVIRQSGGANIVSIPKAIVKTLNLHTGSKLDLSIQDNKIVLTPIKEELTLESLLAGSPKECFTVTDEDKEWLNAKPVGKEIL